MLAIVCSVFKKLWVTVKDSRVGINMWSLVSQGAQ